MKLKFGRKRIRPYNAITEKMIGLFATPLEWFRLTAKERLSTNRERAKFRRAPWARMRPKRLSIYWHKKPWGKPLRTTP